MEVLLTQMLQYRRLRHLRQMLMCIVHVVALLLLSNNVNIVYSFVIIPRRIASTISSSLKILSYSNNERYHHTRCGIPARSFPFHNTPPATTRLYSIQSLISSIEEQVQKQQQLPNQQRQQQTILVGGKGGVGKTSISAAMAIEIASTHPTYNVLIVSTDPAHSLHDALDINDKASKNGQIIQYNDPMITQGRLYVQEVNADIALDEFRTSMLSVMDVQQLSNTLGISSDILESMGIYELQSLIQNPPPGLDELVALSNIFASTTTPSTTTTASTTKASTTNLPFFDVVIVDTAPTGHTLRLLTLPQFLNGLISKLITFRTKLSKIALMLQSMMGGSNQQDRQQSMENVMNQIESFQKKVNNLRSLLQNDELTKFVVVTVPTQLAVAESKRLINELQSQKQQISVSDVIINQCVVEADEDTTTVDTNDSNSDILMRYYERRVSGQQKWIRTLDDTVQKVSQSKEYQQNIDSTMNSINNKIGITKVPYFDVELVGIPALGYIGAQIYNNNPNFDHLIQNDNTDTNNNASSPKVVICGGKGGVGKTTSSSSLAVTMAMNGHKVALISTDPAHSLGDAISMNLSGGQLQDCPLFGVPTNGFSSNDVGSLSVMEIDPTATLNQFKDVVNQLMGNTNSIDNNDNNNGLRDTLKELQDIFDTLPAGTDEVVALAKIVNVVKKGGFDRIVLDTAPTGHTLRMLSTPGFLADLIERLLRISNKINSNSMVQLMLLGSTTAQRREEIQNAVETAKSTLLSFQLQMYDLEDLFSNVEQTEFMIVTVPTELAVRESIRLLNDLTYESPDMPIKVRNIIVNQVLNEDSNNDATKTFMSHVASTQRKSILDIKQFISGNTPHNGKNSTPYKNTHQIHLTIVPYLDTEPRGVFGLKALAVELNSEVIMSDDKAEVAV